MANPLNEFASAYDPRYVAERIAYYSPRYGIDPKIALEVARREGLHGYVGDEGSSFGPFQLHYGNVAGGGNKVGGLGDVFSRTTGLDARDPRTVDAQIQFALAEAQRGGWGPWHGWKGDRWAGISGDHPRGEQPLYETGRFVPQDQPLMYGQRPAQLPPEMLSPQPIAYAQAPQRPEFPSLKTAQQQPQEYSPEDIFEGKHLQEAAPQQAPIQVAAPPAPQEYSPEDLFEGRHLQEKETAVGAPAAQPSAPAQQGQVQAVPESSWGAGQSAVRGYLSGLTGGLGDYEKAAATLGAMSDWATGDLRPGEGFMQRRKDYYNKMEEQRKLYEQQHGVASSLAQEAGNIAGLFTPGGVYSKGAQLVGKGIGAVASPTTAAFLAGEGGVGTLGTAASKFVRGAGEGVGQTLASQGLVEEPDRYSPLHIATSGLVGGVAGAAMSPLFGALSAPFKAAIAAEDRAAAINVMNKHGITVRPSQIAKNTKINELDKNIVPGEANDKQIEDVTKAVAKMVGIKGKDLTPTVVQSAARKNGELLDKIAEKTVFTPVTPNLSADIFKIEQQLFKKWGPKEMAAFDEFKNGLRRELTYPSNNLAGERYRYIVRRNGLIDDTMYKVNPQAAHELRAAFEKMFRMTNPAKAALYKRASDRYKLLDGLNDIVQSHGKIDPTKLEKIAKDRKIGGDFAELAAVGKKMSPVDVNGSAKIRGEPQYKTRIWEALGAAGPTTAAYFGATSPAAAALGAGAAGLHFIADTLRQKTMTSPGISRQVLTGQPGNLLRAGRGVENVLTGGLGQITGGVGFGGNR